ncbi:MmgE/PrpD family protein [Pseudochelatococcus sp. B33]
MNVNSKNVQAEREDIVAELCGHVVSTTLDDIPGPVRERIGEHVMDVLGVGLAASGEPAGRIVASMFPGRETGSRIIGDGKRAEPWDAAWANGTLCHLLDFDDAGFTHPSACTVPAVLAAGERQNATGADFVVAMAVAYEVFARLIRSFRFYDGALKKRGVHTMSVVGGIAAAAGVGKLLRLDKDQLLVAVGLAASQSFGVIEHFGTWAKPAHAGNAARAGVFSAMLAERGYQASRTAVLGHYGLFNALLGEGNYDIAKMDTPWGGSWAIEKPGIGMKAFPLCNCAQRAARAVVDLRRDRLHDPSAVERVEVSLTQGLMENLHVDWPQQGLGGKFSIRYVIAAGLVDGDVTIDSFSDASLERPEIQDMMGRIEVAVLDGGYEDNEFRKATPIRISLRDGSTLELNERSPLGSPDNRMSRADVASKFAACAGRVLDSAQVHRSIALIENLEDTNVSQLVDALVAGSALPRP